MEYVNLYEKLKKGFSEKQALRNYHFLQPDFRNLPERYLII
jgi:hypothetical protein